MAGSPRSSAGSRPPLARSVAFVLLLGLWTWKLLEPAPVPEDLRSGLAALNLDYLAAKCLHAGGYAFLTVLGGTLAAGRRWRIRVVVFLMLHGAATEAGQYLMNVGRFGSPVDVLIDWAGIAAGVWALRRLGMRRHRTG